MKILEVNGRSGSRHGSAIKFKTSRIFMFIQELWKQSTYYDYRCLKGSLEYYSRISEWFKIRKCYSGQHMIVLRKLNKRVRICKHISENYDKRLRTCKTTYTRKGLYVCICLISSYMVLVAEVLSSRFM